MENNSALNAQKLVDLLLNKVEGISWYYFDIRLNDLPESSLLMRKKRLYDPSTQIPPITAVSENIQKILDNIEGDVEGTFVYTGENKPLRLTGEHIVDLLDFLQDNPGILNRVMQRIFDINVILDNDRVATDDARSSASSGMLAVFNQLEKKHRDKRYFKALRERPDFRSKPGQNFVLLAEGDSWFCFPRIHPSGKLLRWTRRLLSDPVRDIVDHLSEPDNHIVFSLAAGGDWLSNMLDEQTQEYVESLSRVAPDVFLVSGGGNDLVSNNRLAHMVRPIGQVGRRSLEDASDPINAVLRDSLLGEFRCHELTENQLSTYTKGLELVSNDFFRFVNGCMLQYFALFYRLLIRTNKFDKMLILTHGYDYPIPSKSRKGFFISWQRLLNWQMNNGSWLYDSLIMRGIHDPADQRAALFVMIHEFNEMLGQIARHRDFPNVFHIDARGIAAENDWFDELHLKSGAFAKVAARYRETIRNWQPRLAEGERPGPDEKVIPVLS